MSTALGGGSGQAPGSPTNPGGQAPPSNDSQGGQAPTSANNDTNANANTTPDDGLTLERARKMIDDLRKSEAQHRVTAKEAQAKLDQIEQAGLSELEKEKRTSAKYQEERDQARAEAQRANVERAIEHAAVALQIQDTESATLLIDWSQLEYDDKGHPTNAEKLLKDLAAKKPWLVAGQGGTPPPGTPPSGKPPTGGGTTNPATTPGGNAPITDALYQELIKDPVAYMARHDDILAYLARRPRTY